MIAQILEYKFPNKLQPHDYSVRETKGEIVISHWDEEAMGQKKPTEAQLKAWEKAMDIEVAANVYKGKRKEEYPAIEDQLDALWHAMDRGELTKVNDFYIPVKVVKDKYPIK